MRIEWISRLKIFSGWTTDGERQRVRRAREIEGKGRKERGEREGYERREEEEEDANWMEGMRSQQAITGLF